MATHATSMNKSQNIDVGHWPNHPLIWGGSMKANGRGCKHPYIKQPLKIHKFLKFMYSNAHLQQSKKHWEAMAMMPNSLHHLPTDIEQNDWKSNGASQYKSVHISTSQYKSIHISTSQYKSIHISTSQYKSVHISTSQYKSIQVSTHQYKSVQVSTSQYTSVQVSSSQYKSIQINGNHANAHNHCPYQTWKPYRKLHTSLTSIHQQHKKKSNGSIMQKACTQYEITKESGFSRKRPKITQKCGTSGEVSFYGCDTKLI